MPETALKLSNFKLVRYFKSFVQLQGKWIGFYGNFGHGDLGDDASFMALKQYLGREVLPLSKRAYAFNPRALKALLIGGGGILRWECPYIPRKLLLKDKWDFPVVLCSAGINCDFDKEYTTEAREQLSRLFELCDYITVRDQLTQQFINDMGFRYVSLMPDLELILNEKPKEVSYNSEDQTVGIVLSPHSEFDGKTFEVVIENFARFADYLNEKGFNVLFLPFDERNSDNPREYAVLKEVMGRVKNKKGVYFLRDSLQPDEMLYVIRKYCSVMACMRLHSAVFAANAGVPFFCVSYNLMHRGFLELLDLPELELPLFDRFSLQGMIDQFEYIHQNYTSIKLKLIEKRDFLRDNIYKELVYIQKIIEKYE